MAMNNSVESSCIELIRVIVNYGLGSKLIKAAKRHGISGGTIILGKGTVTNRLLNYIGITDIRKEIVHLAAEKENAYRVLEKLNQEFEFHKPHHGIAFTTTVCGIFGTKAMQCNKLKEESGADNTMYHIITVIVDRGKAEEVITAATKAGSKGGTIINARGSGIHETSKLFAMEIEPEKEVVIILSEVDQTEAIASKVRAELEIDKPGNGIIFVQNANQTYGIHR
jgi:nitrogen regulatory protein PII